MIDFQKLTPEIVARECAGAMKACDAAIAGIVATRTADRTFANTFVALESAADHIGQASGAYAFMAYVAEDDAENQSLERCLRIHSLILRPPPTLCCSPVTPWSPVALPRFSGLLRPGQGGIGIIKVAAIHHDLICCLYSRCHGFGWRVTDIPKIDRTTARADGVEDDKRQILTRERVQD